MNDFAMLVGNILMDNTGPLLSVTIFNLLFIYFDFSICYYRPSDFEVQCIFKKCEKFEYSFALETRTKTIHLQAKLTLK